MSPAEHENLEFFLRLVNAALDKTNQIQTGIELQGTLKVICPFVPALEIPASAFVPNHVTHILERTPASWSVYAEAA
jgi:hypothetical protein